MVKNKKEFEGFIHNKGFRLTKERLRLLEGIKRQHGHFNVDELVKRFQKEGFKVSRDTVYRNIPILLEAGVIEQSFKTNRDTFYESAQKKKHHDHLFCRNCSKVVEFHDSTIEKIQQKIAQKFGFKLEFHYHQLMGLCKKCRK